MTDIAEITGINKIGLLSLGAYRPERVVTNDEICERIESSDEWIYTRTGIKTRRFAADEETAQTLAIEAGRKAIANALLTGAEIDAVIVATSTHYLQTPASARPWPPRWAPKVSQPSTCRPAAPDSDTPWAWRAT
ncbi:3-oxoacyl-[acyl-carrier-] synthase 3 domain protein [Mycobacteroides abscessus subsp. bolletii 1513]|uniref:3-oxoacyl-[acyl-carrier-] synthase 3 domain protein n=1 Tax=Mycobacteroides abscessus subsp. bolletii 1513 TaxID=1299321 RepID=X8DSS1_9MYCO|nr:3-oxoacyl-[acyl-carrier-] synthase 3 domain protein [Mycobacteroides abscessus subsp. bolletii 1513]